jgi:hypothetical protein
VFLDTQGYFFEDGWKQNTTATREQVSILLSDFIGKYTQPAV